MKMDGDELPSLINSNEVKKYYAWKALVKQKLSKVKILKGDLNNKRKKGGIQVDNP